MPVPLLFRRMNGGASSSKPSRHVDHPRAQFWFLRMQNARSEAHENSFGFKKLRRQAIAPINTQPRIQALTELAFINDIH
jgi:ribosomal protein L29